MGKSKRRTSSLKLTKGNIIAIIIASITGLCTVIAACVGLGVPIITRIFETPNQISTQTTSGFSPISTVMPTSTLSNDPIRLAPVSVDVRSCHAPIFAVPQNVDTRPSVSGDDPFERFNNTFNFLNSVGIPVAAKSVNSDGVQEGDDPHRWVSPCEPSISFDIVLWNNLPSRILVKEFVLIVEAYDYQPAEIPNDYKLVFLIPPDLYIGPDLSVTPSPMPTRIPSQFFTHELKATSNSLPFLSLSNTPPIIIEPATPMSFGIYLHPISTGTFRTHLSFNIEDNQGNQITLNSDSIITKWISVDNLDATKAIPIDVK